MSIPSQGQPEISLEEVDREIRAIFTSFARQFKDLPGATASQKADVYIAKYIALYQAGHREAEAQS